MGQSIAISELSIKVRLDSKGAKEGLRNLERRLAKLERSVKSSLKSQKIQVNVIVLQEKAVKRLAKAWEKVSKKIKKSKKSSRGMYRTLQGMRREMLGMKSLVLFGGSLIFLNKIWETMKKITRTGADYSRSLNTVGASVRNSSFYEGNTKAQKAELVRQNQAFTGNVAYAGGLDATDTAAQYAKILSAADGTMDMNAVQDMFGATVDFGMVQGLGKEKMKLVMNAMSQMLSKGVISLEELRQQLGEHAPLAMKAFAKAITASGKHGLVTKDTLQDLVSTGKVLASETMPHLAKSFRDFTPAEELALARKELGLIMDQTETAGQFFSLSAVNQYKGPLGELITQFNELIKGKGFGAAVGQGIRSMVLGVTDYFQPIFDKFEAFEKKFNETTSNFEKRKLVSSFVETTLIPSLEGVFAKIKEKVLDPFASYLASALKSALKGVLPSWLGGEEEKSDEKGWGEKFFEAIGMSNRQIDFRRMKDKDTFGGLGVNDVWVARQQQAQIDNIDWSKVNRDKDGNVVGATTTINIIQEGQPPREAEVEQGGTVEILTPTTF